MANPQDLVNRYKYPVLAILVLLTVVYGYYLFRLYGPQPEPEKYSVPVAVLAEGHVQIDGVVYDRPETLKAKVAEIQQAHPAAGFSITAPRGDMIPTAKAVVLLQNSGARTVWVLNEPQSAP